MRLLVMVVVSEPDTRVSEIESSELKVSGGDDVPAAVEREARKLAAHRRIISFSACVLPTVG